MPEAAAKATRSSRTAAEAAKNARPLAVVKPDAKAEPKAEAKPEQPTATGNVGARPVTYYFPTLTLADGTVVECAHSKYGHERVEIGERCLRALAASHNVKLA